VGGNTRGYARPFTLEEIKLANELRHVKGWEWEAVRLKIGSDVAMWSLKTTVSLYRRGKWNRKKRDLTETRKLVEKIVVEDGITHGPTIAKMVGLPVDNTGWVLRGLGLGLEDRKEYAK
jgi:hypothetical protein